VDGVIGENGAFYFIYDRAGRRMRREFWSTRDQMASNRTRLDRLGQDILAAIPGSALASDQPYRLADLAIDYCEDVPRLSESAVERIVDMFVAAGGGAKVSSIHVNGWFGAYDKLTMTRRLLKDEYAIDAFDGTGQVIFAGDSPNDEPMFGAFELSVGVANIREFTHRIVHRPAYVTQARSGQGFVELVDYILASRTASTGATAP
jgi:hypothetical protein